MSTFIKSIDPNHMVRIRGVISLSKTPLVDICSQVTFGEEGFFNRPATANWVYEYDGASGEDYDAAMALQNIDFGTVHLYFSSSG